MKANDLLDLIGEVDDRFIVEAKSKRRKTHHNWTRLVAAVACLAIIIGVIFGLPAIGGNRAGEAGIMTVMAAYPDPVLPNKTLAESMNSSTYRDWQKTQWSKTSSSKKLQPGFSDYYMSIMNQLLVDDEKNTVCSPLNIYIAFAMLAEVSDGSTRQQILDMLGAKDIETLREQVSVIWESNYVDTPSLKSILANSIWLNNRTDYNNETLQRLAKTYYVSSFSGEMGSAQMNEALQKWVNDNTGDLLSENTKQLTMDANTVLEIISTIYFKAMWVEEFSKTDTVEDIFHGTTGDTSVQMMKKSGSKNVYRTDEFTSVSLGIYDSGAMHFFLPNENVDVNALAANDDIMKVIESDEDDPNLSRYLVHMSVPKFKVSNYTNLIAAVQKLGIRDALNPELADFTPLASDGDDIYLDRAQQAATVEIYEDGVTGAAYTALGLNGRGPEPDEEIDFTLNRPFMFVVTGQDHSILFSGIMRNIE